MHGFDVTRFQTHRSLTGALTRDSVRRNTLDATRHFKTDHYQIAKVDDEDFERLSKHRWCAQWNKHTRSFYAIRSECGAGGKKRTIRMHREIMQAKRGDLVDHESHDTLDNRRRNIRVCSTQQNSANQGVRSTNTSGFKGVSLHKPTQKWRARVMDGRGKSIHVGLFLTAADAARAYDEATLRVNGEFALTNQQIASR